MEMSSPLLWSRRGFGLLSAALLCGGLRDRARAQPPEPASPTLKAIRERRRLRVGMHPGFAPFVVAGSEVGPFLALIAPESPRTLLAADGRQVAGLDVDLAAATAQSLGAELHITLMDRLDALFPPLCRGEVDLVLSGITRTLPRAAYLSFSSP